MVILDHIYDDLYELSNIGLQKRLWLGECVDIGYVSSSTELFCRLFDDDLFDDFVMTLNKEEYENLEIIYKLITLHTKLNEYNDNLEIKNLEDVEILEDPKWFEIVSVAQEVLHNWKMYMYIYLPG